MMYLFSERKQVFGILLTASFCFICKEWEKGLKALTILLITLIITDVHIVRHCLTSELH